MAFYAGKQPGSIGLKYNLINQIKIKNHLLILLLRQLLQYVNLESFRFCNSFHYTFVYLLTMKNNDSHYLQ